MGHRCLVGRSRFAQLRLTHLKVSSEHASIYFNASVGHWEIRDLGSRNGTQVNGEALVSGRSVRLSKGDRVCFGEVEEDWQLVDDAPPGPGAYDPLTGDRRRAEQGVLWLSEGENVGACVYLCEDGWVLEERNGQRLVEDGTLVQALGRGWTLELPPKDSVEAAASTVAATDTGSEPRFHFRVSRDQEQVHLRVDVAGREHDLGVRTHHYLLLTLARRRHQDEQRGSDANEAGWVYSDELARMLALDPEHTNVMVFRARDQFRQKGLEPSRLIERRPASRQVRFGYSAFEEAPRAE
jgi:hypothetical protein